MIDDSRFGSGRSLAIFALVCTMFVWGSTFAVTKVVLEEVEPFTVTVVRFAIGLAVLTPFAYRQGFRIGLAVRPAFVLFGLTGVALYFGLQNLGLVFTTAGNAALIQAGVPAVAALLAFLFLGERIPALRLVGVGVSILGVLLVSGVTPSGGEPGALLGNVLILGSVMAYGAYATQGKALRTVQHYPVTVVTLASFIAGLFFLLPLMVGELWITGVPDISFRGWVILLYLGAGASALTLFMWNFALRYVAASAAALYINLVPVFGLGFALLLGESAGMMQLVGGALAIAGVLLGDTVVRRRKAGTER